MTLKLVIPGRPEAEVPKEEAGDLYTVETVYAASLTPAARAAGVEHEIEVEDDDILELDIEGGFSIWTRADQYREDLEAARPQAERGREAVRVHALPQRSLETRGFKDWVVRALRVLRLKPSEAVATVAVKALTRKLEDRLEPAPGLYRCPDPKALAERIAAPLDLPQGARLLVLLHGTASSTAGSFGALSDADKSAEWRRLLERFGGHVYALQHRTLSESPIDNALELARLLPRGARLHLVSHSRGGLVGELLCRGPVAEEQLRRYARRDEAPAQSDQDDRQALRELAAVLAEKALTVERYVRVACPARGTVLASRRLDRYLSVIVNLLGLIPPLKASPTYRFSKNTLLALVKRKAEPRELPGLEAMMPEAPLIALLNDPGAETAADLGVIAGDIEGGGLLQRLGVFATDLYYREDHDLVVNTRAMYGGVRRRGEACFFFDQGPEVSHFNYFRNPRTRARLYDWLTRREAGTPVGFQPMPVFTRALPTPAPRRGAAEPRPVVFVLPGIMGTHLSAGGRHVWLDIGRLAIGGMRELRIDSAQVAPEQVFAMAYGALVEDLGRTHEVIPFPYDWRKSIAEEGRRLGLEVMARLRATGEPVRLLAHSMGGLVARAMIAQHPEVWEALCARPGGRLLMLGTPNRGSYAIPRMLLGQDRLTRQLALLDLRHSEADLLAIVARYPGVLEMLPREPGRDFLDPALWDELGAKLGSGRKAIPNRGGLEEAAAVWDRMAKTPPHPERICYVAGCAPATPCGLDVRDGRAVFQATNAGDGRVTYALGALEGVAAWYMEAEHGKLASHRPAFPALLDLLRDGRTARLETRPPVVARGKPAVFELPEEPVLYPTEEDLAAAAIGCEPEPPGAPAKRQLAVSVVHGDLRYARYPVVVGHYQGDTLVSAEAYLDARLDRALSQRYQLGLYPGAQGTVEVILRPEAAPPGAVVVGLSAMGELTPQRLVEGVRLGALRYALQLAECARPEEGATSPPPQAGLSFLLIGCGTGPGLVVEDAVAAMLRGVELANRELAAILGERECIDEVEFLELYEDQAIHAAHALSRVAGRLGEELDVIIDARPTLREGRGGRQRTALIPSYERYWRRILVADAKGGLKYTMLSDRARSEVTVLASQRELVDGLIAAAVDSPLWERDHAATLFELLVPSEFKDRLAELDAMVLVVKPATANYPWELLVDRKQGQAEPVSVRSGMIRQLQTPRFRTHIRASTSLDVLVVGDPVLPQAWPELPGAREEAEAVAEQLNRGGYTAHAEIHTGPLPILNRLFARPYRIIHLAGHGDYRPAGTGGPVRAARAGMVLGDGLFLTAAELGQLRELPDLVFINCCHLGKMEDGRRRPLPAFNKLAASVARELIEMGVRAVIAAGWAVEDRAAKTFAQTFYEAMLSGETFGRAVLGARRETYRAYPETNTWGAYQAYGDPDFALRAGAAGAVVAEERAVRVAPREYLDALGNIAGAAGTAGEEAGERLRGELEDLLAELPVEWRGRGDVLAKAGEAWGELGEFGRAIECCERALANEEANVPLRLVERLANLEVRWSRALGRGDAARDKERAREVIEQAVRRLQALLQLAETGERLSLLASAYKRLAQLADGAKDAKRALEQSRDCYRRAGEHAFEGGGKVDPYPVLNWLTCEALLGNAVSDLDEWLARCEAAAAARLAVSPSFWDEVTPADAAVVRHLIDADLDQEQSQAEIVGLYGAARARGASRREWRSVLEQLEFLAEMLNKLPAKPNQREQRDRMAAAFETIRARLGTGEQAPSPAGGKG